MTQQIAKDEVGPFSHAVVVGASGGIGGALLAEIQGRGMSRRLSAWSRSAECGERDGVDWVRVDITDEASIAAAAEAAGEVDLVIVATGLLHADGVSPEKTWRALDPAAMARSFQVNAIGPALVAKHLLGRFPRDRRAIFAALSARVGSIGDNRLGGWHSYRASKAALNQIIRTLSIELRLRHPHAVAVGLHPGTVDTPLSRPFQGNVAAEALVSEEIAAERLLDVLLARSPSDSGRVFDWAGKIVPE